MAPSTIQTLLGQVQLDVAKAAYIVAGVGTVAGYGTALLYVRKIEEQVPSLTGVGFATNTRWMGVAPLTSLAATADANGLRVGRTWTKDGYTFYIPDTIDTTRGVAVMDLEPA